MQFYHRYIQQYFKKADIFLFAALILLGILSAVLVSVLPGASETVEITVNGEPYGIYDLYIDRILNIDTEYGHNTVKIFNGSVSVTDADCSGQDCIHFGSIGTAGQVIMCLPHRLIITVTDRSDSATEDYVDAVIY